FEVCYEASCGYGHFHDLLRPLAARVLVAHPGQLRLIFRSKNKNDRHDAERLAKLALGVSLNFITGQPAEERGDVIDGQLGLFGDREKGWLVGPHQRLRPPGSGPRNTQQSGSRWTDGHRATTYGTLRSPAPASPRP